MDVTAVVSKASKDLLNNSSQSPTYTTNDEDDRNIKVQSTETDRAIASLNSVDRQYVLNQEHLTCILKYDDACLRILRLQSSAGCFLFSQWPWFFGRVFGIQDVVRRIARRDVVFRSYANRLACASRSYLRAFSFGGVGRLCCHR